MRVSQGAGRVLTLLRWGLIPHWTHLPPAGPPLINARLETVAEKPSFRTPFRSRRCLIPADGFYEWKKTTSSSQPYHIELAGGQLFAMAGLWDLWRGDHGRTVESCAILTTAAQKPIDQLHRRMPLILAPAAYESWLSPAVHDPRELLATVESSQLRFRPVDSRVNDPRHDKPTCLQSFETWTSDGILP